MKKNKKKIDLNNNRLDLDEEYINLNNLKWILQKQEKNNFLKYIFYVLLLVFFLM